MSPKIQTFFSSCEWPGPGRLWTLTAQSQHKADSLLSPSHPVVYSVLFHSILLSVLVSYPDTPLLLHPHTPFDLPNTLCCLHCAHSTIRFPPTLRTKSGLCWTRQKQKQASLQWRSLRLFPTFSGLGAMKMQEGQ